MFPNPNRVMLIAEIGSNHNGDLDTALELISVSASCGADVCKFQSFLVDDLLAAGDPNYDRLKMLEIPRQWYPVLMKHCVREGVRFLSTATNHATLDWMEEDGAWGYKVASCNITHRPLLDRLIRINKPVIVSTGMTSLEEVTALARHFDASGLGQYAFLHCVSRYPALPEEMRLHNIVIMKEALQCPIGFSDHSTGTHMAVAAVALGARIVEKHISLDKAGQGLDHEVAMLPGDFKALCRAVREVEQALFADFIPDREVMFAMRRSLHFSRDMKAGDTIGPDDLKIVRPEDGLMPEHFARIQGLRLAMAVKAGQAVLPNHLEER